MAHTLGYLRTMSAHGGKGAVIAYGTVAAMKDAGSFGIHLDSAGSQCMRNVQSVVVTQIGTVAAQVTATGSSSGYVTVDINRLGSFVIATPGGTIDLQFIAIGGGGSI